MRAQRVERSTQNAAPIPEGQAGSIGNQRATLLRNAGVMLSSQLATWTLTLALTLALPRALGATAVGQLQLSLAIWTLAAILVGFGTDTLLTKAIARDQSRAAELLGQALTLRIVMHVLAFGIVVLVLAHGRFDPQTLQVVLLGGIAGLAWQLSNACQATLQGLERMEFVALGVVAGKLLNTVACIGLLLLGFGVVAVMLVGIMAALLTLAIQLGALRRLLRLRPGFAPATVLELLRDGRPYLISGAILVGYGQMDSLLLALLADEQTLGWYGAAFQLFGTLLFIPTALLSALFPQLVRKGLAANGSPSGLLAQSFDLLLVLGVPLGLGIFVIAQPLVMLLFGPAFAASGPVLALLGLVLILTYQNTLLGQALIAQDQQRRWAIVMGGALALTVPLDLLLIPWSAARLGNGALGGALSFLLTELAMLLVGLRLLPRGTLGWTNARLALRVAVAGLIMACVAWLARNQPIVVPVVLGAATYTALVVPLRLLTPAQLALLRALPRRFRQRHHV